MIGSRVQPDFESLIAEIVDRRIAAVLGVTSLTFSTERPALYPPGKRTRRAARDAIREVPGALHEGRVWSCSRDAYRAHHARPASTLRSVPAPVADDDAIANAALLAAGLRLSKRTA